MPKDESERSASDEIQYWKNLNNIGCLNPEACDRQVKKFFIFLKIKIWKLLTLFRTIMFDPKNVDPEYDSVDGGEFMLQLLSDDSPIMNPFFCYYRHSWLFSTLTDTGEDSKLVHRRKRPKVETLCSSLFRDASERRVWLSTDSRPLLDVFACIG